MNKVLAVVSFVISGVLVCHGLALLGLLALGLLGNAYLTMSPDSDGTLFLGWSTLMWVFGASLLSFLLSIVSVVAGILLWRRHKK